MADMDGKVAIVTGAASGIGRATARLFAGRGAKVVAADIAEQGGRETAELIRQAGGEAVFVKTDVASPVEVQDLVSETFRTHGAIDILPGNAGILRHHDTIDEVPIEEWRQVLDVNLTAPHPLALAYAASKHGLLGLTRSLAALGEKDKIRVSCVCPHGVATGLAGPHRDNPALLQPEDVARAVYYLATAEGVNGSAVLAYKVKEEGKARYAWVKEYESVAMGEI